MVITVELVPVPGQAARTATRTVTATEARVHLGEMIRVVTERLSPEPEPPDWYERMMDMHRRIAEKWQGPGLTAEEVDDMINYGQR